VIPDVPVLSVRRAYARWGAIVSALASGTCGLAIILSADAPALVRLLGAAICGISLIAAIADRWHMSAGTDALRRIAGDASAIATDAVTDGPGRGTGLPALEVPHPGTAQDLQTAMRLFGSEIIDQVNTSVSTVLTENHQMREMASEMATASAQAKDQFKHALLRAVEAESGIEQLKAFSGELTVSIELIGSEVKRSIAIGSHHARLRRDHGDAVACGVRRDQDD
jgi:hypothetical protein